MASKYTPVRSGYGPPDVPGAKHLSPTKPTLADRRDRRITRNQSTRMPARCEMQPIEVDFNEEGMYKEMQERLAEMQQRLVSVATRRPSSSSSPSSCSSSFSFSPAVLAGANSSSGVERAWMSGRGAGGGGGGRPPSSSPGGQNPPPASLLPSTLLAAQKGLHPSDVQPGSPASPARPSPSSLHMPRSTFIPPTPPPQPATLTAVSFPSSSPSGIHPGIVSSGSGSLHAAAGPAASPSSSSAIHPGLVSSGSGGGGATDELVTSPHSQRPTTPPKEGTRVSSALAFRQGGEDKEEEEEEHEQEEEENNNAEFLQQLYSKYGLQWRG
eukprot:gnl/Spiro4/26326_TR13141_c0_g1_i1.p1 gnl/Spiro4/26326_TR13141_c0_g1~~gnl/Spiro4/26326_TR13141_c0_g1_i1.p1  ORF type:complete len:347 (+),score=63.69 gnl/Spiro4/26326_TR13141_c0_g1_i1:66-1043(+)